MLFSSGEGTLSIDHVVSVTQLVDAQNFGLEFLEASVCLSCKDRLVKLMSGGVDLVEDRAAMVGRAFISASAWGVGLRGEIESHRESLPRYQLPNP